MPRPVAMCLRLLVAATCDVLVSASCLDSQSQSTLPTSEVVSALSAAAPVWVRVSRTSSPSILKSIGVWPRGRSRSAPVTLSHHEITHPLGERYDLQTFPPAINR